MIEEYKLKNGNLAFVSPYDTGYIAEARLLGGKFITFTDRGRELKGWSFPADVREVAVADLKRHYGVGPAKYDGERVTVRLGFPDGAEVRKGLIHIFGFMIASARGRDSGAYLGDNVSVLAGLVDSSGSVANWTTRIWQGTELLLRNVPREYLDTKPLWGEVLEVTNPTTPARLPATPEEIAEAVHILRMAGYTVTPPAKP